MNEATDLLKADLEAIRAAKIERAREKRRNPNAIPRLTHAERCGAYYALWARVPRKAVAEAFGLSTTGVAMIAMTIRFPRPKRTPGGRPIIDRDQFTTSDERDRSGGLLRKGRLGSTLPPAAPTIDPERAKRRGVYTDIAREFLALGPDAFGEKYFDRYMRDRLLKALDKTQIRTK
jgi:hypothetical protein